MLFNNGFEFHAAKIIDQVKTKGFCTKSQLEYLMLYNEIQQFEKPYYFNTEIANKTKVLDDKFYRDG